VEKILSAGAAGTGDWLPLGCIIFSQFYDSALWLGQHLSRRMPDEKIAVYASMAKSGIIEKGNRPLVGGSGGGRPDMAQAGGIGSGKPGAGPRQTAGNALSRFRGPHPCGKASCQGFEEKRQRIDPLIRPLLPFKIFLL
jgi:hypothetical protein